MDFEFFDACFYIPNTNIKNFKIMTTTISTSSKNQFSKIRKYLTNKRIFFTPSLNNGVYALTIFDLSSIETTSLLNKMTKHFHLSTEPMQFAQSILAGVIQNFPREGSDSPDSNRPPPCLALRL